MKIERQDNGFKASEKLEQMVATFNRAVEKTFPNSEIRHFLYGDNWFLTRVVIGDGHYGDYNIFGDGVRFNGHCCLSEDYGKFTSLTYNDELYTSKLFEIANN